MAVQLAVSIKILHGDGAVIVNSERGLTVMNPRPRDIGNDGDLALEHMETMLEEMGKEAETQIGNWKSSVLNILGGGS